MNDGGSYTQRQAIRDAQHAKAYREWVASLPADERARLSAMGLEEPLRDNHRASGTGLDDDIANSPAASVAPVEPSEPEDTPEPTPATPADNVDERVMDVLRRLLGEVLTQKNARLTLECLAVACGLTTLEGESMTSIARRHGVSRAAVSKRCVDITEKLNLPPSRSMRSPKARKVYRQVQHHIRQTYERTRHPGK